VEFIDDYRFLVTLGPFEDDITHVVLMDTEKDMGGVPAQTSFQLSPYFCAFGRPSLLLERGAHKPSPSERLAPFYQDPTQRIAALTYLSGYLVFSVETLVRLSKGREGYEIGWDEWTEHVVAPSIPQSDLLGIWVSGCRLFCITSPEDDIDARMEVYDFSRKGCVEYLSEEDHPDLDGVKFLPFAGADVQLPWDVDELVDTNGSHESVMFFCVSVLHLHLGTRLNDALRVAGQVPKDDPNAEESTLHIWTF
jgi:hypothetical protein